MLAVSFADGSRVLCERRSQHEIVTPTPSVHETLSQARSREIAKKGDNLPEIGIIFRLDAIYRNYMPYLKHIAKRP